VNYLFVNIIKVFDTFGGHAHYRVISNFIVIAWTKHKYWMVLVGKNETKMNQES
jgi:hypothetical protein